MTRVRENLATEKFTEALVGARLPVTQLSELVKSEGIIIVHFLRHLGCIFCRRSVEQLYKLKQETPNFPTIYFVHQSSVAKGENFFNEFFPGAPHISDPKLKLYKFFGIKSLGGFQLLNPKMIMKGIQLTLEGYRNKIFGNGNIMLLSGTFLFKDGQLIWKKVAEYAGDEPQWERLGVLSGANGSETASMKPDATDGSPFVILNGLIN